MPAVELVAMIDPPPAAIRCGTATTNVFHTPVRLMSSVSCQTCGVTSSQVCTVQMPALAQTMSSRPSCATPSSTAAFSAGRVPYVGLGGDDPAVQRLDVLDRLGQVLLGAPSGIRRCRSLRADVDRDDVGALLGQPDRVAATLAAGGPGDEGDLALDAPHRVLPSGDPGCTGIPDRAGRLPAGPGFVPDRVHSGPGGCAGAVVMRPRRSRPAGSRRRRAAADGGVRWSQGPGRRGHRPGANGRRTVAGRRAASTVDRARARRAP